MHQPARRTRAQRSGTTNGYIYRSACQTTIWLGPERNDSTLAMDTLNDLGSRIAVDWNTYTCYLMGQNEDEFSVVDLGETLGFVPKQWTSITRLLERPWFERLWIWQEIRLAKRVAVVCGYYATNWDRFRNACLRIYAGGSFKSQLRNVIIGLYACNSANCGRTDLLLNVQRIRHCKCSDKRLACARTGG